MIKAKHHVFIYPMFKKLTGFLIKRNFSAVHYIGAFKDNGNAVLVISNHTSWWDGFWIMALNLKRIKRKFHFMMLEDQLKKHWYFQYSGGFSIKKGSRSAIESLNYTSELLQQKNNMVFMFPQGKIHSIYNSDIVFEKGADRILKKLDTENQIVLIANLVDYFSNSKPNLYIYFKTITVKDLEQTSLETAYKMFYENTLAQHKIKVS